MNVKFMKPCVFLATLMMLVCETAFGQGQEPGASFDESKVKEVLTPGNRRALVGKDCMLNKIYGGKVDVISGIKDVGALCDTDLENFMSFESAVTASIGANPVLSVRDVSHHYRNTYAGFRVSDATAAIGLKLGAADGYYIQFYCEGEKVGEPVKAAQGVSSFTTLDLGIGENVVNNAFTDFYAMSPADEEFDEIGFFVVVGGVSADVAYQKFNVQYAYVGQTNEFNLVNDNSENNLKDYATYLRENCNIETDPTTWVAKGTEIRRTIISEPRYDEPDLVLANGKTVVPISGYEYNVSVKSDDGNCFIPAGTEVGFVYDQVKVLNLGIGTSVSFVLYPKDEAKEPVTLKVATDVLELSLVSVGKGLKASVIAPFDCSGFSYKFGGFSLLPDVGLHYAFARVPADVDAEHHCPINASLDVEASECDDNVVLRASMPVTWECVSAPSVEAKGHLVLEPFEESVANDGNTAVSYCVRVTGFTVHGKYVFRATAEDGCYEETTVNFGTAKPYNPTPKDNGEIYLVNTVAMPDYKLSDKMGGGIILGPSTTDNPDKILTSKLSDYATLNAGLELAANAGIIGVRTTDQNRNLAEGFNGKFRVGFVVSSGVNVLSADALKFMNIMLLNDGDEVYRAVVKQENAVDASLIGTGNEQKYRITIEVDNPNIDFDEVVLFSSGVLSARLSALKIYHVFVESAEYSQSQDPYYGSTVVSAAATGASYDWSQSGEFNLVSISSGTLGWSALIDDDLNTCVELPTGLNVAGAQLLAVNVGRTVSPRQQLTVVMGNLDIAGLLGADVANVIKAETYLDGVFQEEINSWHVIGADVLKIKENHNYMSFTPTTPFNQVVLKFGSGADVLKNQKIYGLVIRDDSNNDGIPDIIDPHPYTCDATQELVLDENFDLDKAGNQYVNAKLFFQRKFVAGKWNSLILPVDLSAEQFAQAFGDDAKLSEIDRVVDKTHDNKNVVIRFKDAKPHENGLKKNVPYIINITEEKIKNQLSSYTSADAAVNGHNRTVATDAPEYSPSEDFGGTIFVVTCDKGVEYNTSDDYLDYNNGEISVPVENDDNISQGTIKTPIVFKGSFASKQALKQGDYIFNNGDMYHLTKDTHWMRGYRCWFTSAEEGKSLPAKMTFTLEDGMGNVTVIDSIDGVDVSAGAAVYNINGQKVNSNASLYRGVYIKNGKKFVVK